MTNDNSQWPEQDSEQLSADDLAVLQAFEARDTWATGPLEVFSASASPDESRSMSNAQSSSVDDEMLLTFASEVEEDIKHLRHALSLLEQDDALDMSRFNTMRRIGHKIRGTAGSINHEVIGTIGAIIEEIIDQTTGQQLFPLIAISMLVQSVHALEQTLQSLLETGRENSEPLTNLESDLDQLNISHTSLLQTAPSLQAQAATNKRAPTIVRETTPSAPGTIPPAQNAPASSSLPLARIASLPVSEERFQQLIQHAEQLAEQRTPLENAQAQVRDALQALHNAQIRLQQHAANFERLTAAGRPEHNLTAEHTASSLIAHVLSRTAQRIEPLYAYSSQHSPIARPYLRRSKPRLIKLDNEWDELEMTRYTGLEEALRAMSEAIANVSHASSRVQHAYSHLDETLQRYVTRAASVRQNTLLLRLVPISTLVEQIRQSILASRTGLSFEVRGAGTELDAAILETLTRPLLYLIETCVADIADEDITSQQKEPARVWLHVQSMGNEVMLELGFSMTVQGGALETLQEAMRSISGTIALHRNERGGVSFLLHVPRTQGTLRGLLVSVGKQQVIVPFSQVQRIDDEKHAELDIVYHLERLLDTPRDVPTRQHAPAILVMPQGTSRLVAGVLVDEILSDVEVIVKPLASYLQRPGITGASIDGKGHVQLLLNLPELVRHYNTVLRHTLPGNGDTLRTARTSSTPRILVADDSLAMRHSLLATLRRGNYELAEAADGMEALEQLTKNPPDVFLLDMEMPNLSGYDLLSIIHLYHELNNMKVIMLTSRASEKHRSRALELGAHAYLTKPCPSAVLLETVAKLLEQG